MSTPTQAQKVWEQRCAKERSYYKDDLGPAAYAAGRQGNELNSLKTLRTKLEGVSADFTWAVEVEPRSNSSPTVPSRTTALAELARGVPSVESNFARVQPAREQRRVRAVQQPTVMPWQHSSGVDPCFVAPDALQRWRARNSVCELPRMPHPVSRSEATITGQHARAVGAWRKAEVPLSQWDPHERSNCLEGVKSAHDAHTAERSRAQLSQLLKVTAKVSKKKRWYEN